jgi:type VI secretion system protein ImpG
MDPRLLRYYNQELQHLREMGAEFAQAFPKIAGRLRMDGLEVADPYVERLLEGFAFLASRIQLKLDAEFPRFTQRLLEIVYPHFLAPTPAMLIAQLQPQLGDAGLAQGAHIPRGTMLRSAPVRGTQTPCQFRTGHDVTLWPIEIAEAAYFTHAANLPLTAAPGWRGYQGGLRLKLRATAGLDFSQITLQDLRVYCSGIDEVAYKLHELLCGQTLGAFVLGAKRSGNAVPMLPGDAVEAAGFGDDEALLPVTLPGFAGYRLLQEYFAFPQRFLAFDLRGVGDALRAAGGSEVELVFLFARGDSSLQQTVDAQSLALHCVSAINLFEQRCDRIHLSPGTHDFHVVVDRTRPLDFEVHELLEVEGHGSGLEATRKFLPLYAAFHTEDRGHSAYYAVQREPRLLSEHQRREGTRSSYIGTEVFISIVDSREAPYPAELQQLGVRALCSNRDLPLLMGGGATSELTIDGTAQVAGVRILKGPSRPVSALREGNLAWKFINQLSLNHLSLLDTDAEQGAAALREMLRLYVSEGDAALQRQIDGLRFVRTEPVVRRLPIPGPIAFGRGVRIELEVDELAFQGASAYLLGSLLERFFARHVSMNGFTELRLRSQTRGEILTGRPRCGTRAIV